MQEKNESKTIALLDVDNTLLYEEDNFNIELLEALKTEQINHVILFTDMTFRSGSVEERNKVVNFLEENGFTVLAVATVLDYSWNLSLETLKKFWYKFNAAGINLKNYDQDSADKLAALLDEFPDIKNLIESKDSVPETGIAFKEASNIADMDEGELKEQKTAECREKSFYAKLITDMIGVKRHLPHSKGLMFEQLVQHKPDWIGGFIYCDDREDCLNAVIKTNHQFKYPLRTVLVSKKHMDTIEYYKEVLSGSKGLLSISSDKLLPLFSFLSAKEKVKTSLVCKHLNNIIKDNSLWKKEIESSFGPRQLRESMAIKPTNLFDAHRKLANERALLLKLGHAFRIAFKVNLYVSADTESILFKDDNPQSSQFVDFNKQNIYPLLKKAEHCRGYSAILNFLWDIQRDPFCEKLITGYHIGSDKTGYIQICSLQDFISQVKKLQIETLNDQNHDNNSRCLIS